MQLNNRRPNLRQGSLIACTLVLLGSAASSCGNDNPATPPTPTGTICAQPRGTAPSGALVTPLPDDAMPLQSQHSVQINPEDPSLLAQELQPQKAPATVTTPDGSTIALEVRVNRPAKLPGQAWIELFFLNESSTGIRDATATIENLTGATAFYDYGDTPWATATDSRELMVGGIAPEGMAKVSIGVEYIPGQPITFDVKLAGTTTKRTAVNSAPLAMSPDGKELWATFPDGDVVAVIETQTDAKVAEIQLPGHPSSVAITPDGAFALVTSSECNSLSVIDRATREVVQIFTEPDIGRDPRNVVVSPDGTMAFVSAYVGDIVTAFERVEDGFRVKGKVDVGRRAVGLSITPDSKTLMVGHWLPRGPIKDNEAWLSHIDAKTIQKLDDLVIDDESNEDRITCLNLISIFQNATASELAFEGAYNQTQGLFLNPGGGYGIIPGVRIAPFPILEGNVKAIGISTVLNGANSPLSLHVVDMRKPAQPKLGQTPIVHTISDRSPEFLKCLNPSDQIEFATPYPDPADPDIVEFPGSIAPNYSLPLSTTGPGRFVGYTRGGRIALTLGYVGDHLIPMDGATQSPLTKQPMVLGGSNPTGIVLTPDGTKGYVSYENSTFISVLDMTSYADPKTHKPSYVPLWFKSGILGEGAGGLITFSVPVRNMKGLPEKPAITEIGKVELVAKDPLDAKMRRGKVLFTSSNPEKYPTLSGHPQAACAACHPNGGNDGVGWPTVEGERRTLGLWGGTEGRGWLHSSATHADANDFATIIVRDRLGGTGLSEQDRDALASYLARGIAEVQRPNVDATLAERGQKLFQSHCTGCHKGPKLTSVADKLVGPYGGGDKAEVPQLYDVGSATDSAGILLGTAFMELFASTPKKYLSLLRGDRDLGAGDPVQTQLAFEQRPDRKRGFVKAPPLVNLYENVVFFHDCRYGSLAEVVEHFNGFLSLSLSNDDKKALVEYLKTL